MAVFDLNNDTMRRMLKLNGFPCSGERAVLFGIRGCLPLNEKDYGFSEVRTLETTELDYRHPRCTIGVWLPEVGMIACFAGSTVPHASSVEKGLAKGGGGANQLVPSYICFKRGPHPRDEAKPQHPAFLQDMDFAVQRTADDLDYDVEDAWQIDRSMGDNLHCGSSQGSHQAYYSSFGCQVVCGTARRSNQEGTMDAGAWPAFRDLAYGSGEQRSFPYALFSGRLAQAAVLAPLGTMPVMLRYGSEGPLVAEMQDRLGKRGFDGATRTGRFGKGTLMAVRGFQKECGLPPDGVLGPDTGALLGIDAWARG